MPLALILAAAALAALSGVPGLFLARSSSRAGVLGAAIMVSAAGLGLSGSAWALATGAATSAAFPWPAAGGSLVGVDRLSAFFLVPVFLMGGVGSVYGLGYWPRAQHPRSARRLELFWGLLVAGMVTLVASRHALAFLLGWEVMALAAFFLVASEDHRSESRDAALLYLIAAHVGTLALFALFALWRWATGSYALEPVGADVIGVGVLNGLFLLALTGFGLKAGVMPLHFWLPPAHAAAPSHVSAMLSGVVLKMGVYGMVRFLSLVPSPPPAWGALVLLLGGVSALLGVVFAIGQHDLKRLLAYHSVENVGIILMGLGLATLGRSMGRPEWVVLGMAGCLLHVWNHGLFKGLLFLCAGSVVHATRTREIDRLGGLGKAMPWTAALFVVGAVAICGLPPLNGFVSELFVYLGLLHSAGGGGAVGGGALAALVPVMAPLLGMAGALALACFVKVHGAVFGGTARSGAALHAREAPLLMRLPMLVLAAGCGVIGLAPFVVAPVLDTAIRGWTPEPLVGVGSLAPLPQVALLGSLVVVLTGALWLARRPAARAAPEVVTWDCGYARPGPRMQYSASSFADTLVTLFRWALRPHVHSASVHGPFPAPSSMRSHVEDPVLDRLILPVGRGAERWFGWFRRFQHGLTQHYLLYVLATVLLMLATLIPVRDLLERLLSR